jgi:protein-arginine kinase activator protein McsA
MEQFKNMTIDELMQLLVKLTRENEIQASECNKSITFLSKSDQPIAEVKERIMELHEQVQNLINENKKFVSLFKGLMNFNKFFNANLEFVNEDEVKEEELNSDIHFQNAMIDLEAMNLNELNKLLEQCIAEEKYEDCAKIKALIEKSSV